MILVTTQLLQTLSRRFRGEAAVAYKHSKVEENTLPAVKSVLAHADIEDKHSLTRPGASMY